MFPDLAEIKNELVNHFDVAIQIKWNEENYILTIECNKKCFSFFYYYWHYKKDIIISMLKSHLHLNKRIFARNCKVEKVSKIDAQKFLNENHLMGYARSTYHYALIYNSEIVSIASFSKGKKMNRLNDGSLSVELVRYASKKGYSIVGGLSKLLNCFESDFTPGDIMTYIDPMWSDGKSFIRNGFYLAESKVAQTFYMDVQSFELFPAKNFSIGFNQACIVQNQGTHKLIKAAK